MCLYVMCVRVRVLEKRTVLIINEHCSMLRLRAMMVTLSHIGLVCGTFVEGLLGYTEPELDLPFLT